MHAKYLELLVASLTAVRLSLFSGSRHLAPLGISTRDTCLTTAIGLGNTSSVLLSNRLLSAGN